MAYKTQKQALDSFRRRYSEDEYTCTISKIIIGYVYVATPIAKAKAKSNPHSETPVSRREATVIRESFAAPAIKAKEPLAKVNSFATAALSKAQTQVVKKTAKIDDKPTSDEAIKAVIASRARRKKPVPYVREEFTSVSTLNINQHDTDRPRCIYCGDYRSGIVRDHVVSVAWRGGVRHYDRSHIVPSCPQCNSLLGDKPLHNIADRAAFLIKAIAHHERKYLSTVDRTSEELAEMDHFLAISVKSALYEKGVALLRIEYAKQVAAGYYDYATIKHLVKQGKELS